MKSKLLTLVLTIACASMPALRAADEQKPARERGPGGPGGRGGPNLEMLAEELQLTPDQKAKLGPILKGQAQKMQDLRQDESVSPEQRREKMRSIREDGQKAIEAVLTSEQAAKFAEFRARGPRGDGERPAKPDRKADK